MATTEPKRSVLVIYTGGTIGMKMTKDGYVPAKKGELVAFLMASAIYGTERDGQFVVKNTEGAQTVEVAYRVKELSEPLDSSNMNQKHWNIIARVVQESYTDYDGFVVLHGTDTMVYTASALSFMFENLEKPVVFTGSQIPIYEARTDASHNLMNSVIVAATCKIQEVLLYFRSDVFRANRCVKEDNSNFEPFFSANHPPLIKLGVKIKIDRHAVLNSSDCAAPVSPGLSDSKATADGPVPASSDSGTKTELKVCEMDTSRRVGILHVYPGITTEMVKSILDQVDGVVLLSYGAGNVPSRAPDGTQFLHLLKGRLVINVTQCLTGAVTDDYETGRKLKQMGVVPGGDITTEAAFCKLCYLLAKNLSNEERLEELGKPLRKEMTEKQGDCADHSEPSNEWPFATHM